MAPSGWWSASSSAPRGSTSASPPIPPAGRCRPPRSSRTAAPGWNWKRTITRSSTPASTVPERSRRRCCCGRSATRATSRFRSSTGTTRSSRPPWTRTTVGTTTRGESARTLMHTLFSEPRRYDLGRVGRYKLNKKLGLNHSLDMRTLTKEDLVEIIRYLSRLVRGETDAGEDDIDPLGNRRGGSVGELLQNQFRTAMLRMERVIRERMTIQDTAQITPQVLINIRPVVAAIKEFFGSSQLSQFMDQTNPLAELTHKRRLSALGPGGLSRERAGFEVRDVHPTHYGRMCPIETPEGPNVVPIASLSTYARVNDFGFIETPYRKAKDGVVSDEIEYLTADEEEKYTIAQANAELDARGRLTSDRVSSRSGGNFVLVPPNKIEYIDVSPKQLVW